MQKRGLIILGIGIILISISFSIALTIFPDSDPTLTEDTYISNLFDDLFDYISDETLIYPGDSASFTYSSTKTNVPLMWGLQIIDFQDGDHTQIHISTISDDDFATVQNDEPIIFDAFVIDQPDVYNFKVENTGNRAINVMMMFVEDPQNSQFLNDPDSTLVTLVLPLAISGILLIIGIIMTIIGIIISIMDWKKEKDKSRYY